MTSGSAKILLAEDSEPMRLTLRDVLHAEGYDLLEATDGVTALLLAQEHLPDLVLLDLYLPGMAGIELAEHFQGWMPFLVITVDEQDQSIQTCIEHGALGYIVKPIRDIDLKTQVRTALARGKETRNLRRGIQETQVTSKAIGLLMAHFCLTEEAARRLLCAQAAAQRRRAADLATDLVGAFDLIHSVGRPA
jgi:response regulator NasT